MYDFWILAPYGYKKLLLLPMSSYVTERVEPKYDHSQGNSQ